MCVPSSRRQGSLAPANADTVTDEPRYCLLKQVPTQHPCPSSFLYIFYPLPHAQPLIQWGVCAGSTLINLGFAHGAFCTCVFICACLPLVLCVGVNKSMYIVASLLDSSSPSRSSVGCKPSNKLSMCAPARVGMVHLLLHLYCIFNYTIFHYIS